MRKLDATPASLLLNSGRVLAWFDRDADYPDPAAPPIGRVFVDRKTGEFVEVAREAVEPSPDLWLELPIPDHALHHRWFRKFLGSIGCEDEYYGSIGRWLRDYGSDARVRLWSRFRSEQVLAYVVAKCRSAGIDAEVH